MTEIWDCFFFRDELDMLETRLLELEDSCDRFVLVEGDRTHTGTPKPLVFDQNRDRFKRWEGRIVYVVARLDAEMSKDAWSKGRKPARDRDDQQRQALGSYLEREARPNTFIMVSDLDEIPDRDAFGYARQHSEAPLRFIQQHAIYFANWLLPKPWLAGTLSFRGDQLSLPMVRGRLGHPHTDWAGYRELQLDDAGIHISFLGGAETIRAKFSSYSDSEFNDPRFHGAPHLERCIEFGIHYQGRDALRMLKREELSPLLRRLSERPVSSTFFDFRDPPLSRFQARAYCGYTWMRTTRHSVPDGLLRLVDQHPGLAVGAGAPAFWAVDAVARARRRMRPVDPWPPTVGIPPTASPERVVVRWR